MGRLVFLQHFPPERVQAGFQYNCGTGSPLESCDPTELTLSSGITLPCPKAKCLGIHSQQWLLCLKMACVELESDISSVKQHQGDYDPRGQASPLPAHPHKDHQGACCQPQVKLLGTRLPDGQVLGVMDRTTILAPSHGKNQTQKNCTLK